MGVSAIPPHTMRVELRQNLDGDFPLLRVQQRVDGRQMCIESCIYDAAAYRDDHAEISICWLGVPHLLPC